MDARVRDINTISILDEYLFESEIKKNREKVMSSHHPSSVSSCLRALYYRWKNAEITDPTQPKDIWRMYMGTWVHQMYANLLKETGMTVEAEVELTYHDERLAYPIHGFLDNMIVVNGIKYGVELKTVFGYGAKAIQISGKPREQDEMQMKTYLSIMPELDYMIASYLARDSFYRTEFMFTMNKEERKSFLDFIVSKFMRLEDYVEQNVLPDREYQVCIKDREFKDSVQYKNTKYKSDWQCMYCNRRSLCWAEELNSFEMTLPVDGEGVSRRNSDDTIECSAE